MPHTVTRSCYSFHFSHFLTISVNIGSKIETTMPHPHTSADAARIFHVFQMKHHTLPGQSVAHLRTKTCLNDITFRYYIYSSACCSIHTHRRMLRSRLRMKDWLASFFCSRENGYTLLGRLEGHSGPVNCISFGRDGTLVASGG